MAGAQIVTILSATFLVLTRSAGVAYFCFAASVCALSVKVIKRLIRQPRPSSQKKSYGMPSTHSAVISFYGAYIYLASTHLPIHRSLPDSPSIRTLSPLGGLAVASIIAMSRIWLGHHTWPQVAAGCAYGIFSAIAAYLFWIGGLNVYGEMLETWADSIFGWR